MTLNPTGRDIIQPPERRCRHPRGAGGCTQGRPERAAGHVMGSNTSTAARCVEAAEDDAEVAKMAQHVRDDGNTA